MAVQPGAAGVIIPVEQQQPTFFERVVSHPAISIAAALGIAIVIGYIISRVRGTSSSTTPAVGQDLTRYVPTANTFVEGDLNYAATGNQQLTETRTTNTDLDMDPTMSHPHPPPVTGGTSRIRKRFGQNESSAAQAWDKKHPNGVALYDKPGGKQVGLAGYGSSISIVGDPIYKNVSTFDKLVQKGEGIDQGSSIWYKTANGAYVSQFDVVETGGLPIPAPGAAPTTQSNRAPVQPIGGALAPGGNPPPVTAPIPTTNNSINLGPGMV